MTITPSTVAASPGRVTPLTAGDINIWHARRLADQQITYVLEFDRRLELARLRPALAALQAALPRLGFGVRARGPRLVWAPLPGGGPALSEARAECEPEGILARFIGEPTDPEREPPLKLLLLHQAEGDTLAVKVDHLLTDAAGLKHLIGLLAEAYSTGAPRSATNPDRGLGQVFRRFGLPALLRAAGRASLPRPAPGLLAGPFQAGSLFIEHFCLEPEAFGALRAAAKSQGATLNDAVLTAVYQAVFQQISPDAPPYPIMVPVDMRRYLPAGRRGVIGNLSSAIYPLLAPGADERVPATLARVQTAMAPLKQAHPGLGALLLMAVGAAWGGELMRRRYQRALTSDRRFLNLTNFGVMSPEQVVFAGARITDLYGVGPVQYAPGLLLALSTYNDRLNGVVQGNDAAHFQPFIRDFLREVAAGLRGLAG